MTPDASACGLKATAILSIAARPAPLSSLARTPSQLEEQAALPVAPGQRRIGDVDICVDLGADDLRQARSKKAERDRACGQPGGRQRQKHDDKRHRAGEQPDKKMNTLPHSRIIPVDGRIVASALFATTRGRATCLTWIAA